MPNNQAVPRLYDVLEPVEIHQKTYLFVILEYVENDLSKLLESASKLNLAEDHVIVILYNMLCSLNFVHSANVMHRDIRPESFLISQDGSVKIRNFRSARTNNDNETCELTPR